jgi:hypothetical protein
VQIIGGRFAYGRIPEQPAGTTDGAITAADGWEEPPMARTVAALPAGSRITDNLSLGLIARFFPAKKIRAILQEPSAPASGSVIRRPM